MKVYNISMDGAFGLIFKGAKSMVLLVKRRDIPLWVLPGGGIEPGETPEQAAIREVFEETGYYVEVVRKIGKYTYMPSGKINYTFECEIRKGTKTLSNESKEIEFFPINKLPEMMSPYAVKMVQDAAVNDTVLITAVFNRLPWNFWMKALLHPWALFKFLLTKIGIHWNT